MVTEATRLLLNDYSKFSTSSSLPGELTRNRSQLSAQFSETRPKVVNYDPEKPIAGTYEGISAHLMQDSQSRISSISAFRRPASVENVVAAMEMLDVMSFSCSLSCKAV